MCTAAGCRLPLAERKGAKCCAPNACARLSNKRQTKVCCTCVFTGLMVADASKYFHLNTVLCAHTHTSNMGRTRTHAHADHANDKLRNCNHFGAGQSRKGVRAHTHLHKGHTLLSTCGTRARSATPRVCKTARIIKYPPSPLLPTRRVHGSTRSPAEATTLQSPSQLVEVFPRANWFRKFQQVFQSTNAEINCAHNTCYTVLVYSIAGYIQYVHVRTFRLLHLVAEHWACVGVLWLFQFRNNPPILEHAQRQHTAGVIHLAMALL